MVRDPNILLSMANCKLRDCCRDLEDLSDKLDMSVEEGIKYVISCGIVTPELNEKTRKKKNED